MGALLLSWIPWAPARVVAFVLAAGVFPGYAVASRITPRRDVALGVATALSPAIFACVVLLTMLAGAGVDLATHVAKWFGVGTFLFSRRATATRANDDHRALIGAFIIIAAAAVLALSLPLAETWWRVREDSWFHAAVANKLARDGLPLTDPYFAGLRIQYMYAYHAVVAACASLCRIDYFHAMIVLNAIALASTVLAFFALAGEFTRRAGPRLLATCLWIFGLNGWFYLSYPIRLARAVFGETHGLETLRSMFAWTPAGHATAMKVLSVEGNQFMFLDKFMVGTALSLTFGLAATLLLLLVRARRGEWSPSHDVAFVLCIVGAMLLHMVTGLTIAIVTAVVLAVLLVVRAQPAPGGPSYARLVAWIVFALAITAPYVYSVMPRGSDESSIGFALQRSQAIGLLFAVLPALVFAISQARSERHDATTRLLAAWAVGVAVVALTVDLATNNETKFAFLLYLPLAALAAGALERGWDAARARRLAVALVASAIVPLHAIYFAQAIRDPSTFDVSDSERAVYGWIAKSAPRDAVVVEDADNVRVPVLASRDLYFGTEGYARNWGYPHDEMLERRRVRDAVFSQRGPADLDLLRLRALERPVYIVYRLRPDDMIDAFERFENDRRMRGRFATREIAVWEVVGESR